MIITAANLDKIPSVSTQAAKRFAEHLHNAMVKYHITTPSRICAFLAQLLEESGHLVYVEEIASGKAYEGRKDLGNTHAGDGMRYKGRGLIQISGRFNYAEISKDLGIDFINVPKLLETTEYASLSAAWFWARKNLNGNADLLHFAEPIDTPPNLIHFGEITRKINGGYTHLAQRIDNYKAVKIALYGK